MSEGLITIVFIEYNHLKKLKLSSIGHSQWTKSFLFLNPTSANHFAVDTAW